MLQKRKKQSYPAEGTARLLVFRVTPAELLSKIAVRLFIAKCRGKEVIASEARCQVEIKKASWQRGYLKFSLTMQQKRNLFINKI